MRRAPVRHTNIGMPLAFIQGYAYFPQYPRLAVAPGCSPERRRTSLLRNRQRRVRRRSVRARKLCGLSELLLRRGQRLLHRWALVPARPRSLGLLSQRTSRAVPLPHQPCLSSSSSAQRRASPRQHLQGAARAAGRPPRACARASPLPSSAERRRSPLPRAEQRQAPPRAQLASRSAVCGQPRDDVRRSATDAPRPGPRRTPQRGAAKSRQTCLERRGDASWAATLCDAFTAARPASASCREARALRAQGSRPPSSKPRSPRCGPARVRFAAGTRE